MNYLLLGGAQNIGKTQAITGQANRLINSGFQIIAGSFPGPWPDFKVVLEGPNKNGNQIKLLLNSATDDRGKIKELKDFIDQLGFNVDAIISSVRDRDDPRTFFFSHLGISPPKDFFLEIPMAKITRRNNLPSALTWYHQNLENIIIHILGSQPFNL